MRNRHNQEEKAAGDLWLLTETSCRSTTHL